MLISAPDRKYACVQDLAEYTSDYSICYLLPEEDRKDAEIDFCISDVAETNKKPEYCEFILNKNFRSDCLRLSK